MSLFTECKPVFLYHGSLHSIQLHWILLPRSWTVSTGSLFILLEWRLHLLTFRDMSGPRPLAIAVTFKIARWLEVSQPALLLMKPPWYPWELKVSVSVKTQTRWCSFEPWNGGSWRIQGASRETFGERVAESGSNEKIRVVLRIIWGKYLFRRRAANDRGVIYLKKGSPSRNRN